MNPDYNSEIQEIVELTRKGVPAQKLEPYTRYLITDDDGKQSVVETGEPLGQLAQYRNDNVHGNHSFHDPDSFLAYVARHGIEDTEIWADTEHSRLTAVLDAPGKDTQRLAGHRANLTLVKSNDWQEWRKIDRQWVSQAYLAQFIEDHFANFKTPTPVRMLEMAQKFEATKRVKYKSATRLQDSSVQFTYEEHIESKGGGQYKLPETLKLNVQVFEYAATQDLTARLHYRINSDNALELKVLLDNPQDVESEHFRRLALRVNAAAAKLNPAPHFYFGPARSATHPANHYY